MGQRWKLQTRLLNGEWEDVGLDIDDALVTYETEAEAEEERRDLLLSTKMAFEEGFMDEPYADEDWRVAPV